ncbi:hypothetical protein [Kineococcus terrestris]|uniref:hypothetical protein n=1 Tax=Kineococcus terrestris TaxID=2044856 RepID=UPI0034DB6E48
MLRLHLTSDAEQAGQELLERARDAEDLRPVAEDVLDVLQRASARQFATGAGWPRSEKAGGLTLVKSGRLRDSLTRGTSYTRTREGAGSVEIETTVPYAEYLAAGARGMPARDPARVDEWRVRRDVAEVLARHLTGGS